MKKEIVDKVLLRSCIGLFLLNMIAMLTTQLDALGIIPGVVFWVSLALAIAVQIPLSLRRRAFYKALGLAEKKRLWGALCFYSNPPAKVADTALAVSFVLAVILIIATGGFPYICTVMVALTAFLLSMHCVLNGKNFYWVTNRKRILRALERKKARKTVKESEGE